MITQFVSGKKILMPEISRLIGELYYGYENSVYATYYKGNITQGETASESINKMLEKVYG